MQPLALEMTLNQRSDPRATMYPPTSFVHRFWLKPWESMLLSPSPNSLARAGRKSRKEWNPRWRASSSVSNEITIDARLWGISMRATERCWAHSLFAIFSLVQLPCSALSVTSSLSFGFVIREESVCGLSSQFVEIHPSCWFQWRVTCFWQDNLWELTQSTQTVVRLLSRKCVWSDGDVGRRDM